MLKEFLFLRKAIRHHFSQSDQELKNGVCFVTTLRRLHIK